MKDLSLEQETAKVKDIIWLNENIDKLLILKKYLIEDHDFLEEYNNWYQKHAKWFDTSSGKLAKSYRDYWGFAFFDKLRWLLWKTTEYFTSVPSMIFTGLVLTFIFGAFFAILDRGRGHLVKIEKPLELKTRLSETPLVSFGEKVVPEKKGFQPNRQQVTMVMIRNFFKNIWMAWLFNSYMFLKFGFGNIRVQLRRTSPVSIKYFSYVVWFLGFLWYFGLIYTISVTPLLKGIF